MPSQALLPYQSWPGCSKLQQRCHHHARLWSCSYHPHQHARQHRRRHSAAVDEGTQATGLPPDAQQPTWQLELPEGPLVVAPLQAYEVAGAAVLVARAFAGSPGLFSFEGISEHYTKILSQAEQAKGLILSARLTPTDPQLLPRNRDSLMIGTMCISYDESTHEGELFPPLPKGCAYVTNLAVDARFRRRGVASALLRAGEEVTFQARRCPELCLHVREKDTGAQRFYAAAGFVTKSRDKPGLFGFIRGQRQQFLMSKLA